MGWFESYGYDAFARRTSLVAKNSTNAKSAGGTTTYEYYKSGLLKSETLPVYAYTAEEAQSATKIKNTYEYDVRGNLKVKTEAAGFAEARATTYTYDKRDRLLTTTVTSVGITYNNVVFDAVSKAISYNSNVPVEKTFYDLNGNVTKTEDAAGTITIFFYDQLNRKTHEVVRSDRANNRGVLTTYGYNADGDVTNIRIYENTVSITASANGGPTSAAPALPSGNKRETTFAYDGLGRMTSSSVLGVTTGSWNGSSWSSASSSLDTLYQYDYLGNLVKVTHPNGHATFSYYDRLSRKTAQLDAQGYLTDWVYTSEGQVEVERRYANRFTGTPSTSGPPSPGYSWDDRITNYAYDKVGNRTAQFRYYLKNHAGNGTNTSGNTTDPWNYATVTYLYNGLGQVVQKTEATGEQFSYLYDEAGRLKQESRPTYASNSGNVTPKISYFYNGLGNLTRSEQAAGGDAGERVTRYYYGAAGRLHETLGADGNRKHFRYDVAGRLTIEYYDWVTSGSSTVGEGIGYRYDALGRSLGQAWYKWDLSVNPDNWVFQSGNDWTSIEYNSFGDVTRTGVNGIMQQENKYDLAGRLWATNSGDGVWKYFGYDKNGNQTLAITSAGADLTGKTFSQALAMVGQADVNATYTMYDKRNLAVQIYEEGRDYGYGSTTLGTGRSYNAFGEVATETNAIGATVTYTYNTMGKLIKRESPTVQITHENGVDASVRPTEEYYYDKSGRLVATRDANGTYAANGTKNANTGNLTLLTLLAGTGYGGSEALVTQVADAGGGITKTAYNIHGDARKVEVLISTGTSPSLDTWRTVNQTFDGVGRLTGIERLGTGVTESFTYDLLGQRLAHTVTHSLEGSVTETSLYDIQGRVISATAFGGDVTTYAYGWESEITANGMVGAATGGWKQTTTYANGKTLIERTDLFGRADDKTDLGGKLTTYAYDVAGRLITAQIGATSYNYQYYNTGDLKRASTIATTWAHYIMNGTTPVSYSTQTEQAATYTYDGVGNRKTEVGTTINNGTTVATWKNHTANYDALGRLLSVQAATSVTHPEAITVYQYDANGNIRSKTSTFFALDGAGQQYGELTVENWYRYDSMNRVVLNNGAMIDGEIKRRPQAPLIASQSAQYLQLLKPQTESITYDRAGQRTSNTVTNAYYDQYGTATAWEEQKTTYIYDVAGRLAQTKLALGTQVVLSATNSVHDTPPAATGEGARQSSYTYDYMGRQKTQKDYAADGTTVVFNETNTWNSKGQLTNQTIVSKKTDGKTYSSTITNQYGSGATYALGAVVTSDSTNAVTGQATKTSRTSNTFEWWDGAVQKTIAYDSDTGSDSNTVYNTDFYYNGLGQLIRAQIADGMSRTVTFSLDELGQVVRRDETRPSNVPSAQTGSPHEVWYRFGGAEFGYVSNNHTLDVSISESIGDRQIPSPSAGSAGTFRFGSTLARTYVDFDSGIDRINSYEQGSAAGSYTARGGESLRSIAQKLYGDAALWYKLAEANSLSGGATLFEGQQLILPAGVVRSTYNAGTVKPYDPASAIGDLSPTAPKPPKHGKSCGFLGTILLAAIAIAVAIVLPELIPALGPSMLGGGVVGGAVSGAIGAAAGSVVSQSVGVATGIQEKFSFKGVALAAIGGAIGGGLGGSGIFGKVNAEGAFNAGSIGIKSGIVDAAVRGATGSVLTQGVAVATGLQSKFSWAGVAAAGVASGVGYQVGGKLAPLEGAGGDRSLSNILAHTGTGVASLMASAATRGAIEGTSFEKNLLAGLPDVIGQVLGRALAGAAVSATHARPASIGRGASRLAIEDTPAIQTLAPAQLTAQLEAFATQLGSPVEVSKTTKGDATAAAQHLQSLMATDPSVLSPSPERHRAGSEFPDYVFGGDPSAVGHINGLVTGITRDGGRAIAAFAAYDGESLLLDNAYEAFAQDPDALEQFADYIETYGTSDVSDYQQASDAFAAALRGRAATSPRNEIIITAARVSERFTTRELVDTNYRAMQRYHSVGGDGETGAMIGLMAMDVGDRMSHGESATQAAMMMGTAAAAVARRRGNFGPNRGPNVPPLGPGTWQTVNEAMSPRAAAYQNQITGRAGEVYVVNGVRFDGFDAGALLDAKGPGYAKFVKDGEFRSFFRGQYALVKQAENQISAANGTPVTWHVAEATAAGAMRALLSGKKGITIVHTPVAP